MASIQLPEVLRRYFAAASSHDVEGTTSLFTDGATVRDEGREHRGAEAIGHWMRQTFEKYDYTVEPTDWVAERGTARVTAIVSGHFPGSPVRLRYAFLLRRGKIVRLEIG